ncbi:MAG: metabolite traffic protein EboE [Solirubrobacteraceae bacterium]
MRLASNLGHLSYGTLVHPADNWEELWTSLTTYLPRVKERVAPNEPFGVSLRLAAESVAALRADSEVRNQLRTFLDANDLYVYTVNAFPYGSFKGRVVKEQVYEPDWRSRERAEYTIGVAEILAEITDPSISPSIQSSPLAFKPKVKDEGYVDAMIDNVLAVVAHLVTLRARTGRLVRLALEPEPYCYLETTAETLECYRRHLYSGSAATRLSSLTGLPLSEAHGALREHLGITFDICHQAVVFDDIPASLRAINEAGIPIFKLQAAAALYIPQVGDELIDALSQFANAVYLTQTFERANGSVTSYLNLDAAVEDWQRNPRPCEWRVHVHVPVFIDDFGAFKSTRFAIEEALAVHKQTPISDHLEIETYTWDVLPASVKDGDIVDYVSRELEWVRDTLAAGSVTD